MNATVELFGESYNISIIEKRYQNNDRVALVAVDDKGGLFGVITVNDDTIDLKDNEILVKTWTENFWVEQLPGIIPAFEDTGVRVPMGYVDAQIWKYTKLTDESSLSQVMAGADTLR